MLREMISFHLEGMNPSTKREVSFQKAEHGQAWQLREQPTASLSRHSFVLLHTHYAPARPSRGLTHWPKFAKFSFATGARCQPCSQIRVSQEGRESLLLLGNSVPWEASSLLHNVRHFFNPLNLTLRLTLQVSKLRLEKLREEPDIMFVGERSGFKWGLLWSLSYSPYTMLSCCF